MGIAVIASGINGCTDGKAPDGEDADRQQKAADGNGPADGIDEGRHARPDDAEPDAANPLIRGVRRLLSASTDTDNEAIQDLDDDLLEADRTLSRIKRENREALKRANRQVRLNKSLSPNVILIVADRLGYGDLGCYGQQHIRTPNLDRMAAEGMRLTDYYAGSPDGAAARWCLLSGRQTRSARSGDAFGYDLRSEDVQLASALWQAGYTTGIVGFCGIEVAGQTFSPQRFGFEESFGFLKRPQVAELYPEHFYSDGTKVRILNNSEGNRSEYAPDVLMQEVLSFLKRHRDGRPFFLIVSYPLAVQASGLPSLVPYEQKTWNGEQKSYAAAVSRLDRDVGSILDLLDRLGLDRRTATFFTAETAASPDSRASAELFSSHGPFRAEMGLHEGRIRVPLIVRWPGKIPPGTETGHPSAAWDLLPTLVETVRAIRKPRRVDGMSLLPTLLGRSRTETDRLLYWELHEDGLAQAVRTGKWKAIRKAGSNSVELYNLDKDPGETTNVADQYPDIIRKVIRKPPHKDPET